MNISTGKLNTKKIAAWFLIFTTLTSALILALSRSPAPVSDANPAAQSEKARSLAEILGGNAFTNDRNGFSAIAQFDDKGNVISPRSKNLTDNLTAAIASGIIKANPEDIKSGADNVISSPDFQNNFSQYADNIPLSDLVADVDVSKIKITDNFTKDDVLFYFNSLYEALKPLKTLAADKNNLSKIKDRPAIENIYALFADEANAIYALQVPRPFLELHKKILKDVEVQKSFFDVNGNDPLRTLIVSKNAEVIIAVAGAEVKAEIEKAENELSKILGADPKKSALSVFINNNFGVPQAHAQWVVTDIIADIESVFIAIESALTAADTALTEFFTSENYFMNLIVEAAKDALMKMLSTAVANWIAGGGSPKFVTNWGQYFADAAKGAALTAISGYTASLCQGSGSFAKLISQQVGGAYGGGSGVGQIVASTLPVRSNCLLEKIVPNPLDFYGDFGNGGWLAYVATALPSGNYYGARFEASQLAAQAADSAKQAANSKAISGSGLKSQESCDDGSDPNVSRFVCTDGSEADENGICADGDLGQYTEPGLCADGSEPQVTTPGTLIASTLNQAIGSNASIERIVNADSITSLLGAIVNYAINKLIAAGTKGLLGVASVRDVQSSAESCDQVYSDHSSQAYQDCVTRAGGITTLGNQGDSGKDAVLKEANVVLQNISSTLDYTNQALSVVSNIIDILNAVASSTSGSAGCTAAKSTAQDELPIFTAQYNDLQAQVSDLSGKETNLSSWIEDLKASSSTDPTYYIQKRSELDAQFGTVDGTTQDLGDARVGLVDLQKKLQDAATLLQSCFP